MRRIRSATVSDYDVACYGYSKSNIDNLIGEIETFWLEVVNPRLVECEELFIVIFVIALAWCYKKLFLLL